LRFEQINIDHLDKIKSNMKQGKRKPSKPHPRDKSKKAQDAQSRRTPCRPLSNRYINYALAVIRQVWNRACASNPPLAVGDWPGSSKAFKKPKVDNQRKRFLSKNEAALLMQALKNKSQDMYDMSLLSLHCGLRAGEIFALTWDKVNIQKGELLLIDTKNGESRISYLTDATKEMLRQRSLNCEHPRFVFVTTIKGEPAPYMQVPATFGRTVKELGLNKGVTDSRDKVVFHTLRHSYASWLVENGASLPIVRDLLGHKNLIMTSRYSHVTAEAQREAVERLNQTMKPTGAIDIEQERQKRSK
jgi:integrase